MNHNAPPWNDAEGYHVTARNEAGEVIGYCVQFPEDCGPNAYHSGDYWIALDADGERIGHKVYHSMDRTRRAILDNKTPAVARRYRPGSRSNGRGGTT